MIASFTNYIYGDVWCIEPEAHRNLQALAGVQIAYRTDAEPEDPETLIIDGIAHIHVKGVMVPDADDWEKRIFGLCSVADLNARLDTAVKRSDVRGILLVMDTPGGYSTGIPELAQRVASIEKPIVSLVSGRCASAGYWIACSTPIITGQLSAVGSIGCYLTVRDYSKTFEMAGVKTILVTTGEHKGAGEPGTQITDAQIAHFRDEIVAPTGQMFFDHVNEYRGLDESLFDGRSWRGTRAVALGLAERVGGYDDALNLLSTLTRSMK